VVVDFEPLFQLVQPGVHQETVEFIFLVVLAVEQTNKFGLPLAHHQKAFYELLPEDRVQFTVFAVQQIDLLAGQFERTGLEIHVAGTGREQETEIDVDHVAVDVQQDVAVVSVFGLEYLGKQTVGHHRLQKVLLRIQKLVFEQVPLYFLQGEGLVFDLELALEVVQAHGV